MTRWYLAAAAASIFATAMFITPPAWAQATGSGDAATPPMMGQGMMGQGMMGQGMMGRGMGQQPMMGGRGRMMDSGECPFAMMDDDDGMGRHHMMHGRMMGQHMMGKGQGMMHGGMMGPMRVRPMVDTADVTQFFKRYLERLDNDRLKLGKVAEAGEDTITAEIVTVDESLVQTFTVDRVTGRVSAGK